MSLVISNSKRGFSAINRNVIIEIISGLFIALFLYTSISKLSNIPAFRAVLSKSPFIGGFAPLVAWAVPLIEIAISILLFIPKVRRLGLSLATILMTLFTGYLIYMILVTPHLPCSCGGVIGYLTWKQHVFFNLFFVLLGLLGLLLQRKTTGPNSV